MGLITLNDAYRAEAPAAVCLGTFDGVHLGHQALIRKTVTAAREEGLVPTAFTFDVPPYAFFHPEARGDILTTVEEKARLMLQYGIRNVICCPFTGTVGAMDYRDFFERILLEQCMAKTIVIGFHFTFGKDALGNARSLEELCARNGIRLYVIPPVMTDEGLLISSTAIRHYIRDGDLEAAGKMLGRPVPQ